MEQGCPWSSMMKIFRCPWLCLLAIQALFLIHILWLAGVTDDAYITFRFARNLVGEGAIVWNPGQPPVEGYTNFLWMLLCAGAHRLGWPMPLFSQVLGIFSSLLCIGLVYRYGVAALRLRPATALVPCLFLALNGCLAKWSAAGLETSFFTLLLLAGCERYAAYWRKMRRRDLALAFFLLFLATLTRPEGFFISALLVGLLAPFALLKPRRRGPCLSLAVHAGLDPFLVLCFWRYGYFGSLLPNTFYAKTGGGFYQWLRGLRYAAGFGICFLLPLMIALGPALAPLARRCGRGLWRLRARTALLWVRRRIGLVVIAVVTGVYSLYIVFIGGDYMAFYRFFAPLTPLICLLFGAALAAAEKTGTRWRGLSPLLLAVGAAGTLIQSTPLESRLFFTPGRHHGSYRGAVTERWGMRRLTTLTRFFDTQRQGQPASIAADAIGVLGYLTDLTVYDTKGITDDHIAHLAMKGMGKGIAGHEKADYTYIFTKKPTFIMFDRYLHPARPLEPRIFAVSATMLLRRNYRYVTVWLEDQLNHQAGYFGFYELKKPEPTRSVRSAGL